MNLSKIATRVALLFGDIRTTGQVEVDPKSAYDSPEFTVEGVYQGTKIHIRVKYSFDEPEWPDGNPLYSDPNVEEIHIYPVNEGDPAPDSLDVEGEIIPIIKNSDVFKELEDAYWNPTPEQKDLQRKKYHPRHIYPVDKYLSKDVGKDVP